MNAADPKAAAEELVRRCTATNRSGTRCGKPPRPGANVCDYHGGAAPQVKRKAALRLAELVDPAIATLAREMARGDKSSDRVRAANSVLDRAGIGRAVGNVDESTARALLLDRLLAIKEQARADAERAAERQTDDDLTPASSAIITYHKDKSGAQA